MPHADGQAVCALAAPPAAAGAPCRGEFEAAFGATVEFGAEEDALELDAAGFDLPLEGANPELARHNDEIAARCLASLDRNNIRARVHATLIERLPAGDPGQATIAGALHVSPRALQRRLAPDGASYRDILDETRRDLALAYLRDPTRSVSAVTYLLGFSDVSSFTHAFRRWTGVSPRQYRGSSPTCVGAGRLSR